MKLVAPSPVVMLDTWYTRELDSVTLEWCLEKGSDRSASMHHADTLNSKNLIPGRPPYWRHYIGIIGELAYAWFSGQKVDIKTIGRGDTGFDFPDGAQVKTSDIEHVPKLMILASQWQRKHAKFYVLAWVRWNDKPMATVSLLGWISSEEFAAKHKIWDHKRGMGPSMWVHHTQLHPMETLKEYLSQ